jgi:hypothetical protein
LRNLLVFITCIIQLSSCAQTDAPPKLLNPIVHNHPVDLGDTSYTIQISIYDSSSKLVFVHVHDDEQTAKDVTHYFLERFGGTLISIQNNGERLIRFPYKSKSYTFDPNRMFTRKGITESLNLFQPPNAKAISEIENFAKSFLEKIPDGRYVIAMHNNTDNKYTVQSYLPQGSLPGEAAKIHVNKNMDPDDFVLTTDNKIFAGLQKQDINVILQKKKPATDDGSLSILFGRKKKPYINVEAEHGHYDVQLQLVEAVAGLINK